MIRTAFDDFSEYVANEEKNRVFVEYIELYYDCEFTRKGITLVDTPGGRFCECPPYRCGVSVY
ncbi:hypothetical protein GCM10020331_066630 [Ectobacillus funiculus]